MGTRELARRRRAPQDGDDPDYDSSDNTDDERPARRGKAPARRSERPSRGRKSEEKESKREIGGRGWAAHSRNKGRASKWNNPDEFRITEEDEQYLIKFLEEEPFFSYNQHYVREVYEGQKYFTCLEDDCPLCEVGHTPGYVDVYNIVDMNGKDPVNKYWRCTSSPAEAIEKRAQKGPVNADDLYFAVSKSPGKNKVNQFYVDPVKARDVEDDWEIEALTDDELAAFEDELFDKDVIKVDPLRALREAAEALED